MRGLPRETRAGTALLSIQKDTQESMTISIVGKYVCSMKKNMCLLRMKFMYSLLYQPERNREYGTLTTDMKTIFKERTILNFITN